MKSWEAKIKGEWVRVDAMYLLVLLTTTDTVEAYRLVKELEA